MTDKSIKISVFVVYISHLKQTSKHNERKRKLSNLFI